VANTAGVVLLSLCSALAFATSSSLKHVSAGQVPNAQRMDTSALLRFIRATLSHPLWLGAIGADVVGLTLQLLALHLGALSLVQPLLISGLLFALLLRRHPGPRRYRVPRDHAPPRHQRGLRGHFSHGHGRELGWAVTLTVALAAFVLLVHTKNQIRHPVDRAPATAAAVIGLVLAGTCVMLGRRQRSAGRSAATIGIAVGAVYAGTAALLKAVTDIAVRAPLALLTSWQLYAVVVLGALGLLLNQLAFQAGPLTASLPAISTVDPLLSIVVGVWIYDERIRTGAAADISLVILLLAMGIAIIGLSRSTALAEDSSFRADPT